MRLLALCASVLIAVGLAVRYYAFRGVVLAQRVKLPIILTAGSEEGQYEVQIRGQEETPHFVGQGEAAFEDHTVVLPIEADLRKIEPG